jgi:hypothetical protein
MEESDWCDTSYIKAEQHQSSWCWSDAKLAGDLTSGEEEVSTREVVVLRTQDVSAQERPGTQDAVALDYRGVMRADRYRPLHGRKLFLSNFCIRAFIWCFLPTGLLF